MPRQETFLNERNGDQVIEVLKSYDQVYAREAFRNMDDEAQRLLWSVLRPEEIYEPSGLPTLDDENDMTGEAEAFLWDELLEQAREDGNVLSFFVVIETKGSRTESLYVSPDWPSAESFARARLAAAATP